MIDGESIYDNIILINLVCALLKKGKPINISTKDEIRALWMIVQRIEHSKAR